MRFTFKNFSSEILTTNIVSQDARTKPCSYWYQVKAALYIPIDITLCINYIILACSIRSFLSASCTCSSLFHATQRETGCDVLSHLMGICRGLCRVQWRVNLHGLASMCPHKHTHMHDMHIYCVCTIYRTDVTSSNYGPGCLVV